MASVNSRFAIVTEEEILQIFAFAEQITEFVYPNTVVLYNLGELGLLEYSPLYFGCR